MTTNHIEKLDPALIRSGRVDLKVEIEPLDADSVGKMFGVFYPEAIAQADDILRYATMRTMTAANWQELFIRYHDSPARLFAEVITPHLERGHA